MLLVELVGRGAPPVDDEATVKLKLVAPVKNERPLGVGVMTDGDGPATWFKVASSQKGAQRY